jgi:GNAT superfamily N-acetyltransferase
VAERDGTIVGSVVLVPAGTSFPLPDGSEFVLQAPEVRLLAVPPAERGKGIGRALMDECIRRTRLTGSPTITLHTTDMMQVAMQMYERMGFIHDPNFDFHLAPGIVIKGYRLALAQ